MQLILFDIPARHIPDHPPLLTKTEKRRTAALAEAGEQEPIVMTFRTPWTAYKWLVKMNRRIV